MDSPQWNSQRKFGGFACSVICLGRYTECRRWGSFGERQDYGVKGELVAVCFAKFVQGPLPSNSNRFSRADLTVLLYWPVSYDKILILKLRMVYMCYLLYRQKR